MEKSGLWPMLHWERKGLSQVKSFSLFNMTWTDSEVESLITFYSSMLVSGARNFAPGVKNRRQFSGTGFWSVCLWHKHIFFFIKEDEPTVQ